VTEVKGGASGEFNAVINCGCTQVVKNGGVDSVNFITLLCKQLRQVTEL